MKGENYIWNNIDSLKNDPYETIGFELIFPTLLAEAEKRGLNLPYCRNTYAEARRRKLSLVPKELIYSNKTSVSYSMEFLGDNVDAERLHLAQLANGSIGNSPAATAFMLTYVNDTNAVAYLQNVLALNIDGSVPSQYPYDIFEKAWVLFNFALGFIRVKEVMPQVDYLDSVWKPGGVSWADSFPVPDADDSALALRALQMFNIQKDPSFLEKYERDESFTCFEFEMNFSISANIHILDVVRNSNPYPRRLEVIDKILKFLKSVMIDGSHWQDKWHISPYYPTSHAVIAICGLDNSMTERAVGWLMATQHPDGSWGFNHGTFEETGLALLALLEYHRNIEHVDKQILGNGVNWLNRHFGEIPEMWFAKGLYAPTNVVLSTALAAIYAVCKVIPHCEREIINAQTPSTTREATLCN